MGKGRPPEFPSDLKRAQKRFQERRWTKTPKARISGSLWELAVKLVVAHGPHRTARTLKPDDGAIKERVVGGQGAV